MKDMLWPAWGFAFLLMLIVAAGPWHIGAAGGPGLNAHRAPPLDTEALDAVAMRETRWSPLGDS